VEIKYGSSHGKVSMKVNVFSGRGLLGHVINLPFEGEIGLLHLD
jgi:hypothetical protein